MVLWNHRVFLAFYRLSFKLDIFERHLSGSPLADTHSDNEALFPGSYPASRFRWFGASLSTDFGTYKHRFFGGTRYRLESTRLTDFYRSQAHSHSGPTKFLVHIRHLASGKPLNKSPGGWIRKRCTTYLEVWSLGRQKDRIQKQSITVRVDSLRLDSPLAFAIAHGADTEGYTLMHIGTQVGGRRSNLSRIVRSPVVTGTDNWRGLMMDGPQNKPDFLLFTSPSMVYFAPAVAQGLGGLRSSLLMRK